MSSRVTPLVFFKIFYFVWGHFSRDCRTITAGEIRRFSPPFECGRIRAFALFHHWSCPCALRLGGKAVLFHIRSPFTTLLTSFIAAPYLVANSDRRSILHLFCLIRSPWHIRQGFSVVTSSTHHLVAGLFVVVRHLHNSNVIYVSVCLIANPNQSLSSSVIFFNYWQ